jgi:hypothetical protein
MPVYPTYNIPSAAVRFRFGERYISEAANRKFLGLPRGVYLGFVPTFSGNVLSLAPDQTYGVSLARLASQADLLNPIDVFTTDTVTLDFSGHAVYPVNVVLKATGALGQPYSAEIVTQVAAPVQPTELLLGVVTAANTIGADIPANRDHPFAYTNAPLGFGFMPSGSVEDLLNAVAMITEVQDARTDLAGTTHPQLGDRLDADAAGPAVANRLGKEIRTISSETYTLATDSVTVAVSNSFANMHRTRAPLETIPGFGSESKLGAVTSGTPLQFPPAGTFADSDRNVCAVFDTTTERRLLDSTRRPVFARLNLAEITLTGQLNFLATSPTVTGVGTLFSTQIEKGDIIEDGNGDFYEVASTPVSPTSLTLSTPAVNTNSGTGRHRRRFTISFFVRAGISTENPHIVPSGTSLRFFFPMWDSLEIAQFDHLVELFRNHDGEPVVAATTLLPGKVLVEEGASGAKGGAIFRILDSGNVVGDGNFHAINFGAAVDATGGVVNVTARGATGPQGTPAGGGGGTGPEGPQGAQGVGFDYTKATFFVREAATRHAYWGTPRDVGPNQNYSFTHTFTALTDLLFVTGGIALWAAVGDEGDDTIDITNIEKIAANQARITGLVPSGGPDFYFRLFLNGGGY